MERRRRTIERAGSGVGLGPATAAAIASTVGLLLFVGLVAGIYGLVARDPDGGTRAVRDRPGRSFAHSLVPIALAYVVAHYFSMLAFQGQAAIELASDPLGSGHDLFGTADSAVDYTFLSAGVIWYIQVAALTAGHALGLTLAHDRALSSFRERAGGGPLAALDAHRHGRVHEPRPPPPLRLQRLMLPLAHAGHWIGSLLYVAPVALVRSPSPSGR